MDAVLIGGSTLRQANPNLTVRHADAVAARLALGVVAQPRSVVVTASGALSPEARIFAAAPKGAAGSLIAAAVPLVFTCAAAAPAVQQLLGDRGEVVAVGSSEGPLGGDALLAGLWQRGIRRLLVEGGGETLWTFVARGALDVLHVTLAPCLLGGAGAPTLLGGLGFSVPDRMRLRLMGHRAVGDELYVSYSVERAAE